MVESVSSVQRVRRGPPSLRFEMAIGPLAFIDSTNALTCIGWSSSVTIESYRAEIVTETLRFCQAIGKGDAIAVTCAVPPAHRPACIENRCQWLATE
jgi:hypothetical protein